MNEETGPERVSDLLKVEQVVSDLKHLLSEAINTIKLYHGNEWSCFIFAVCMKNKRTPMLSILRV
jgi:hypothetical protein